MDVAMKQAMGAGLLLLAAAGAARAEIFVCEDNGKKTFSQQPCGANAKAIEVQSTRARITLPEQFDARAAYDLCKIIVDSWDLAARMRRQSVEIAHAHDRVFAFLRESVSNFDEFSKTNPGLPGAFRKAAQEVTSDAYADPTLKAGEREEAHRECTAALIKDMKSGGKAKGGGKATTM